MSKQPKIVDFAGLDDQNKTQFLEFLVKNNIQFQKSDVDQNTDYVAKITIKKQPKTPQSKNLNKTNPNHKTPTPTKSTNNKQNKIQTNKKLRASASKSPQLKTPTKANNVRCSPLQSNQNNNQQQKKSNKYCSKKTLTPKNKQRSAKKVKVGQYEPSYHKYQGEKCLHKNQKVGAHKAGNPDKNVSKNTSKNTGDLKRKTNLEKQVSQMLHKYLKIFNLKLAGQRNTKWQVIQLLKSTEQIYDQVFLRTHQISNLLSKNRQKLGTTGVLPKIIKQFFTQKYKSERLGINNLINMLYTLSYYNLVNCDNQNSKDHKNYSSSNHQLSFKMFEDFVLGVYDNEDLLFFVFVRSMIKKYNTNFMTTFNNQIQIDEELSESTIINNNIQHPLDNAVCFHLQRDLMKILEYIFDSEKQLIDEYYSMIVDKAKQFKKTAKISSIQLERILVDDYRVKRVLKSLKKEENKGQQLIQIDTLELETKPIPQKVKRKKKEEQQKTALRPFPSVMDLHNQYKTMGSESIAADQLTFGDQTQEEYRFQNDTLFPEEGKFKNCKFWEINNKSIYENILDKYSPEQPPNNINHMDSHYSQNFLNSCCLETLIINKMQKKVNQLINIMMDYQSYYNSKKQNNQYISPQHNKFNISLHPNSPFFNTSSNMLETKDIGQYNKEEENEFVTEFCSMGDEPPLVEKRQIFKQIILKKCLVLLGCLIQMDKMKWFEQLQIKEEPSQNDMTVIEKLQLIYRKLKKKPEAKAIGELCKTIITVEQLTNALEDLFIDG